MLTAGMRQTLDCVLFQLAPTQDRPLHGSVSVNCAEFCVWSPVDLEGLGTIPWLTLCLSSQGPPFRISERQFAEQLVGMLVDQDGKYTIL